MKNWTVPRVVEGDGVQVGGLERPGMCQPSPPEEKAKVSGYMKRGDYHTIYLVLLHLYRRCELVTTKNTVSYYRSK